MSTPHSAGRTSWPPATGRAVDSLASTSRSKSEVAPGMAFSNVTALLSPSSPTTPWTLELQEPAWEAGRSDGSRARAGGSLRRTAHQEGANGLRRSDAGRARQPEKAGHPHLEKASSWPHRRDAGRPAEGSGAQAAAAGEGASKHKGWHRQGVRRPSILPEGASGEQGARRPCQTRLCPAPAPASILCPRVPCRSPCRLHSPTHPIPAQRQALRSLSEPLRCSSLPTRPPSVTHPGGSFTVYPSVFPKVVLHILSPLLNTPYFLLTGTCSMSPQ